MQIYAVRLQRKALFLFSRRLTSVRRAHSKTVKKFSQEYKTGNKYFKGEKLWVSDSCGFLLHHDFIIASLPRL
jgi:hypothetical protein